MSIQEYERGRHNLVRQYCTFQLLLCFHLVLQKAKLFYMSTSLILEFVLKTIGYIQSINHNSIKVIHITVIGKVWWDLIIEMMAFGQCAQDVPQAEDDSDLPVFPQEHYIGLLRCFTPFTLGVLQYTYM